MNCDYNNNMQLSQTEGDLFTPYERRRGLPIGNLTNQLFSKFARPARRPDAAFRRRATAKDPDGRATAEARWSDVAGRPPRGRPPAIS